MKENLTTIVILAGYVCFFGTLAQGIANGVTILGLAMVVCGYAVREQRQSLKKHPHRQKNY